MIIENFTTVTLICIFFRLASITLLNCSSVLQALISFVAAFEPFPVLLFTF